MIIKLTEYQNNICKSIDQKKASIIAEEDFFIKMIYDFNKVDHSKVESASVDVAKGEMVLVIKE